MKFQTRLATAYGLAILILIAVGILSYKHSNDADDMRQWARHSNVILRRLDDLRAAVEQSENLSFEFAGTRDPQALAQLQKSRREILLAERDLRDLTADNYSQQQRVQRLAPAMDRFLGLLQSSVDSPAVEPAALLPARALSAERVGLLHQIDDLATQMQGEEDRLLLLRRYAMDDGSRRAADFIVAGYLSAILLSVLCAFILRNEMRKRAAIQRELRETQTELEDRVRRRTQDLRAANLALEAEIDRRKHAQKQVEELNASLELRVDERTHALTLSNRELDAFCYSVSHDLRAPLRHVDGFSRILQEEFASQLTEEARRHLDRISHAVTQMGRLIDDLLDLSRIGRKELVRRRVAVHDLVTHIVDDIRSTNPENPVRWSIDELPDLNCDPGLLQLVFSNLIQNAVKFTRHASSPAIQIGAVQSGGISTIFVRDNGVGFDPQYADKLFGVFQRLHRQEDFEGTGIGLATVQRIVHRHGGSVRAESQLGCGATFYFTLGAQAEVAKEVAKELAMEKVNHA